MIRRHLTWAFARLVAASCCGLGFGVTGLVPHVSAQSDGWTAPRTPDGHPNLQGYWTNDTFTPLERPADLGNQALFTPEEAAAYFKMRLDRFVGQPSNDIHYDDAIWQEENYGKVPNLRTSLIVDPPDGRVPPLTAEAKRRDVVVRSADSAQTRSLAERCISWGNVGPPMVPPSYNANFHILQNRDHVVIRNEMIHENRIVPLDDAPLLDGAPRLLAGDSRGRWDGDTLVVETRNFTDHTNFRGAPRHTRQDIYASRAMQVVERFTLIDANTILYQFTVTDPTTWTRPWSGQVPVRRFDGPLYEYACHEGNYGLPNILRAARMEEIGAR